MQNFKGRTLRAKSALAALVLACAPFAHADSSVGGFNASQQDAIGKIAADYLIKHPEVLVQVSQALQQKQQEEQISQLTVGAVASADALLNDAKTPAVGPKDAKVAIVEFFDYQCIYCYHMSETVEGLIKANPNVRFVFKEFPVFGARWPASILAAEAGQYVYAKKGGEAYLKYHNGLFATGKNEGKLTEQDVEKALKAVDLKLADVKADAKTLESQIQANMDLGSKMQIQGTPTFVVMPTKGATADSVTVIPGATDTENLQKAIDAASK